ncbi:MAG: metallophosphoesterase [Geminicoccaceae bacterium]
MRILQLSDSHLSSKKPERAAELEACVSAINAFDTMPDLVVHTGDIAHDGRIEEYQTARNLLDRLSVPYFVLAGNRDRRRNLVDVFADGRHLCSDMPFVQYAVEDFDIRLIMIDSMSEATNKGRLCKARLDHIERMVMADPSRPAAIFLHHPPFRVDVGPAPFNFEDWSEAEALLKLCDRLDEFLCLHSGHVHRSFETSIGDVPASVLSCLASDLRWDHPNGPDGDHLPVFKMHDLSTSC